MLLNNSKLLLVTLVINGLIKNLEISVLYKSLRSELLDFDTEEMISEIKIFLLSLANL